MYGQVEKLEEMKKKLNSVSPSFCLAKWLHVTIHLTTGHTHSCYLPATHKIPLEEIRENPSALHNTRHKKLQRKKMLEGTRPEECRICWEVEDLPGNRISDRQFRGVDSWTMPHFDRVRKLPWDADVNPTYLEVSFSSACNFKCSYCSPHVSSRWEEEISKMGAYRLSQSEHQHLSWFKSMDLLPIPEEQNPYVAAFWEWWPRLVNDLDFFRITGGEPLLANSTYRVLEWFERNPCPRLNLHLNSNMGVPQRFFDRFIELARPVVNDGKVRELMIHTSLDTFGKQAEYIRHGLDFEAFERNIRRILDELPSVTIAVMCTFNALSVVGFRQFLDWIETLRREYQNDRRGILLDIPHMMGPEHQTVRVLTPDFREKVAALIEHMEARIRDGGLLKPMEVEKMKRILEWMEQSPQSPQEEERVLTNRRDFYLFFSEHDRRRGTDFAATFREMGDFWEHCRTLAQPG